MTTARRSDQGFSLVELMVASVITMAVLGITFRTFADALSLNQAVAQVADSSQNLRVGTNLLVRDLMEAGRNIPVGGIAIPSGAGATPIHRPGPDASYTFDNVTQTTLNAITTGDARGPSVDGQVTDIVTILLDDSVLGPLNVYPSNNANNVAKLSVDGTSIAVGPSLSWLHGDATQGIAPIAVGDLIFFSSPVGSTIQTVTKIGASTISFEAGDPFNFNQIGAAAGNITRLLGTIMTVRRVFMYTYYVHEDEPGVPRLMRQLAFYPAQAMAGVVEDLQLSYDLVDGVNNPAGVPGLPYVGNGVTYTASQVRKVNVHVGVRSEELNAKTNDYLRTHVSTVVGVRNLAYVDRYK